jgi:phospholipid/cholesterol/gamma-HCH transport system substrate-binding protein
MMKLGTEMRKGARDITLASRIFLAVAVLSMLGGVGLLAYQQGVFTPKIHVLFHAGTADGMNTGMAVKLVGFKVGSVQSISVDNDLTVRVALKIDAKYQPMIDAGASVRLTREALIGANVLEIRPGSGDLGPIQDRTVLRYEREPSVESAMIALLDQMAPIVNDVRTLSAYLSAPDGDFRQAVRNVNVTAGSLVAASNEFTKLIMTASDRIEKGETRVSAVLGKAEKLLEDASGGVTLLNSSLKQIDTSLPGITSRLEQSLENVRVTSETVRGLVTGELAGIVVDAGGVISDTSEVMRGAKRAWPVSGMVQPPRESMIRLDGGGGLTPVPADGAR